jgi:hypothetical protein
MVKSDLDDMEDVTYNSLSYSDYVRRYSGFLVRTEVQGVDVGLLHEASGSKRYRTIVICDGEELYSDFYPDNYELAYEAYRRQVKFVRGLYTQGWRKEIFYFRDSKTDNVLSVIYA